MGGASKRVFRAKVDRSAVNPAPGPGADQQTARFVHLERKVVARHAKDYIAAALFVDKIDGAFGAVFFGCGAGGRHEDIAFAVPC